MSMKQDAHEMEKWRRIHSSEYHRESCTGLFKFS